MKFYSLEEGERLVKAARHSIELSIISPSFKREAIESRLSHFDQNHGIFVTIEHYPTKELRGCIGFPRPTASLRTLLVEAAVAAANEDPRFVSISHLEFEHIVVEVSILSDPEPIVAKGEAEIKRKIKVGRDGLMINSGHYSGLLLPIVPVEQKWGVSQFLENICLKAGLPPDGWKNPNARLYKFSTQVFREKTPSGEIEEVEFE